MKRYLLVTTAASSVPALVRRAEELHAAARDVTFVLLTPRPRDIADDDAAAHIASADGVVIAAQLRRARLPVERSIAGDPSPVFAIDDELRARPHHYDGVVLASPPPAAGARLLARDDHWRADGLPIPVFHVYERPAGWLPVPLPVRVASVLGAPGRLIRLVVRQLQRPRVGIAILIVPIIAYLSAGLALALLVNRAFLFNEVLAATLYSAMVAAVIILERTDPASRPPLPDDDRGEQPR